MPSRKVELTAIEVLRTHPQTFREPIRYFGPSWHGRYTRTFSMMAFLNFSCGLNWDSYLERRMLEAKERRSYKRFANFLASATVLCVFIGMSSAFGGAGLAITKSSVWGPLIGILIGYGFAYSLSKIMPWEK